MRTPHIHLVCTPPCCAVWRGVSLFAQEHPDYTAVQFEDCAESLRQESGVQFSDLLTEPSAHKEITAEFITFLEAGLDLFESLIVTGSLWTPMDRQKILNRVPDCYRISAWTLPALDGQDFISFNTKCRPDYQVWPKDVISNILTNFTSPEKAEGFDDIYHITEAFDFNKPVVAA